MIQNAKLHYQKISVTTDADGDGTANGTLISGLIYALYFDIGDAADDVDFGITSALSGFPVEAIGATDLSDSAYFFPRAATCTRAGVANVDAGAMFVFIGIPTLTIADGGDTKTCSVSIFWYE